MITPIPVALWFKDEDVIPPEPNEPAIPAAVPAVELVEAETVTELLDGESSRRVTHSFKRLRRSARAKRGGDKRGKNRMTGTSMGARDAASEMTEREPGTEDAEELGEIDGPMLAAYIISEIRRMAVFLETEEGKTRRKGHTDLDVLEKLMNESEGFDLIMRFEQRARRLLESEAQDEQEGVLLEVAERALHAFEDQARNHSIGGIDMARHKTVREDLRAAVTAVKEREAIRTVHKVGGSEGDAPRLAGQTAALPGPSGH